MLGISLFIAWAAYASGYYGYSLIKGYNLSFMEIVSPVNYYNGSWPPGTASNTVIFPAGNSSTNASQSVSTMASVTSNGSGQSVSTAPAANGGAANGIQSNGAAILAAVKTIMPSWSTGTQWNCLVNVINAESGGNLTAQNPSSSAYGIAQFINGPSEYATYGGNSTTVLGQMPAMINYIKQRYPSAPCEAWGHEQADHWY